MKDKKSVIVNGERFFNLSKAQDVINRAFLRNRVFGVPVSRTPKEHQALCEQGLVKRGF